MSWLARSIANSLRIDDDDDDDDAHNANTRNDNGGDLNSPHKSDSEAVHPNSQSPPPPRGVREDLSELTKTISGKFWGVASFLAPPPDSSHPQTRISDPEPSDQSSHQVDDEAIIAGIRNDFSEISGKLKDGISQLSSNKTVHEITKFASSFLQFGSEEKRSLEEYGLEGVVGLTEEVAAFARNIAMHPETWLDFPLSDDEDSDETDFSYLRKLRIHFSIAAIWLVPIDFELSDVQQEHALAIERVAPRLAALRMELCPEHLSDGCFWKIYFVLLHPRLNKNDADLLSTPQIVGARAVLTRELDKRNKEKQESESSAGVNHSKENEQHLSIPRSSQLESAPLQTSAAEAAPSLVVPNDEMEKHPVQSTEIPMIDKPIVEETHVNILSEEKEIPVNRTVQVPSVSANRSLDEIEEDDTDDWLKEEDSSEMVRPSGASIGTGNDDDDVSFSDLEEDDGDIPASYKKATPGPDSSKEDSQGWVQLSQGSPNCGKDINSAASKHTGSEHTSSNSETKDSSDWLNVDDIDVI
ncbi:BSD domain containing protein [Senna tora]|uniref:BSD domain containing protein n=1 Tax=Senna tora TaxID=362788 RepID=A0A834W8X5_9FABA|nr:BSD domain containing protein [Senna tora]